MDALARLVVVGALPLASFLGGCQSQTEGQRCDLNADCESPLVCTSFPQQTAYRVCCPQSGPSSAPACNPGVSFDAGATSDAGAEATAEEAGPDAGGGAAEDGSDAGAE